jgi:hypothetical protein
LSKHSADAANIQKSNSVNHFNLCATIWKVRIFEGTPAIRNSGKKSATDQKRWQISKNDLYIFDSYFSIEFKNKIKLGRFRLKKHNFSVFIIHICIETHCINNKQVMELFRNSGTLCIIFQEAVSVAH